MYSAGLSTHQERLEIVFHLKLKILRDLIFTNKYKNIKCTDILNLISDLIEIRENLEGTQLKVRHMK
jgi:hypothetical protein